MDYLDGLFLLRKFRQNFPKFFRPISSSDGNCYYHIRFRFPKSISIFDSASEKFQKYSDRLIPFSKTGPESGKIPNRFHPTCVRRRTPPQRTSKSGPPMEAAGRAGTPQKPQPLEIPSAAPRHKSAPPRRPPARNNLPLRCGGASRAGRHGGGGAPEQVRRRLRRRLRRPAPPLVRARQPEALVDGLVVRLSDEGEERGRGEARVRGPHELRPEEAARAGILQGHIRRERVDVT